MAASSAEVLQFESMVTPRLFRRGVLILCLIICWTSLLLCRSRRLLWIIISAGEKPEVKIAILNKCLEFLDVLF
jgi:hypothetical protein